MDSVTCALAHPGLSMMDRVSYRSTEIGTNPISYPMFLQVPQGQPVMEDARSNSLPLDLIVYTRTAQDNAEVRFLIICGTPFMCSVAWISAHALADPLRPLTQSILIRSNDERPGTSSPERLIAGIRDGRSPVACPLDSICQTKFPSLALVSNRSFNNLSEQSNLSAIVEVDHSGIRSLVASVAYFKRGHQPSRRGQNSQLAS